MKSVYKSIIIISCLLSVAQVYPATSVSQFGITWTFDRDYTVGQFANGDYWVVGPVTIIGITPASTVSGGRTINGSMLDPNSGQGFDYSGYNALNVARPGGNDLSAGNPLIIQPSHSLVSAISTSSPTARPILTDGAVLTILASVPAVDSFRPPYAYSDKTVRYNVSDINFAILKSLTPTQSTPSLSTVERWFERPWFDWIYVDQYIKPSNNMRAYGRDIAVQTGDGALVLNLNYTNAQKRTLMIRYIQLGIDLYGIIQAGNKSAWRGNGGFSHGRKLPILFAGMALNDSDMKSIGAKSGDYLYSGSYGPSNLPPDYIGFGEDDQTFYVRLADIYSQPYAMNSRQSYNGTTGTNTGTVKVVHDSNVVQGIGTHWANLDLSYTFYFGVVNDIEAYKTTGQHSYLIASIDSDMQITLTEPYRGNSDETGNAKYGISTFIYYGHGDPYSNPYRDFNEFTISDLGHPEWGIRYSEQPRNAGPEWTAVYRNLCSYSYNGNALAGLIMGMKSLWNHNAFFDYTDRWMTVGYYDAKNRSLSTFAEEIWDTYRPNYGPIWPAQSSLYGDVSGDGEINIQDVQACVNHILGKQDWGSDADINKDGKVDEGDVQEIVNIILEK